MDDRTRIRLLSKIKQWRSDPTSFAIEAMGIRSMRAHQFNYLENLGRIVTAKRNQRILGKELTAEEASFANKMGVSIMSGRGSGKDMSTAVAHAWFTSMFEPHLVVATGPNREHLRRVYWKEVEKWIMRRRLDGTYYFPFAEDYQFTATSIVRKTPDKTPCLSIYRTVQKDSDENTQAEGVSGLHEKYVFYVLDEASGIPYPVYSTLKASMTRIDDVRVMSVLFNPNRSHGFAYDIHFHDEGKLFIPLHWDMTELDCADPEAVREAREMYGPDSNYFRVNFRGLPPLSDSSAVIPFEFIDAAVGRDLPDEDYDTIFCCDPAGEGKDRTTLVVKKGPSVKNCYVINESYSDRISDRIVEYYHLHKPSRMYIDKNGVGMGVYSILRTLFGKKVFGINTTEKSRRPDKYRKLRDELWWTLREQFEEGRISLPEDKRFITAEISAPKFREETGVKIISPKKDIKKLLGGRSPDWADAIVMSCYHDYEKYDRKVLEQQTVKRPWQGRVLEFPQAQDPLAWMRG